MARRLGVTPQAVGKACRPGGILHPALIDGGTRINLNHEAAQTWIARRAEKPRPKIMGPLVTTSVEEDEPEPRAPSDVEAELGAWRAHCDLETFVEPLSTLTDKYGSWKEFSDWVKCRKTLEEALKAQMLRQRTAGQLVARTTVQRMIEKIDEGFRLVLSDAPRSVAARIAPNDMARCSQIVREALEEILTRSRTAMLMSLDADDPTERLVEAAE